MGFTLTEIHGLLASQPNVSHTARKLAVPRFHDVETGIREILGLRKEVCGSITEWDVNGWDGDCPVLLRLP